MSGVEVVMGKGEKVEKDHISEEGKGDDPVSSSEGGTFPLSAEGRVGTRPSGPILGFISLV